MDRMGQQHTAELGCQSPSPRRLVVFWLASPRGLDSGEIRFPSNTQIDDPLGLSQPIAKTVLKDRHDPPRCLSFGHDHAVDLGQRPGQRLLADDFLAGRQCGEDLRDVERRRRADVDDVDIVHAQQFVERPRAMPNGEFVPDRGEPLFVDIAQRHHPKLVKINLVGCDMTATDAATDNGNRPDPAFCGRHSFPYSHFL